MTEGQAKSKSDLGVRTASAVVMLSITAAVLWLGGWLFTAFVVLISLGMLLEWRKLVKVIFHKTGVRFFVLGLGAIYILGATLTLILQRKDSIAETIMPIATVIAVDVGAYFAGRTFGGPKIAPSISPSKTWSGLLGGAIAASVLILTIQHFGWPSGWFNFSGTTAVLIGIGTAVVAQAGDFLESWIKRRAGVKDSGNMIPGHGGLLDRLDGLLAVLFVIFIINLPYMFSSNFGVVGP